jgi:hypothetical protein
LGQRTEQSFTGLEPEERTKFYWSWAGGQNKVLLVLGRRTGAHREDCMISMFLD